MLVRKPVTDFSGLLIISDQFREKSREEDLIYPSNHWSI